MMYYKSLLCVFLLAVWFRTSTSCSCEQYTPEEHYCRSSFVAKFKIKSALNVPEDYDYYDDYDVEGYHRVRMLGKPWKFPKDAKNVDTKRLYGPISEGMCKIYLSNGGRYLISGHVSGGQLKVNDCMSMKERTRLERNVRRMKRFPPKC